jgi:hypothetical protein
MKIKGVILDQDSCGISAIRVNVWFVNPMKTGEEEEDLSDSDSDPQYKITEEEVETRALLNTT